MLKPHIVPVRMPSYLLKYVNKRPEKNVSARVRGCLEDSLICTDGVNCPHFLDYKLSPNTSLVKFKQMIYCIYEKEFPKQFNKLIDALGTVPFRNWVNNQHAMLSPTYTLVNLLEDWEKSYG
jgi:hypothetical protein